MTRYLIAIMFAALVVALALAGVQSIRVDRLKVENAALTARVEAFEAAQVVARDDAQTQADRCDARVDQARQSARRIETILERPVYVDQAGCPVRSLLDSRSLRDALTSDPAP